MSHQWQRAQYLVALAHLRVQALHGQASRAQALHRLRLRDADAAQRHLDACKRRLAHVMESADGLSLEQLQRWRMATVLASAARTNAHAQQTQTSTACAQAGGAVCAAESVLAHLQDVAKRAGRRYRDQQQARACEASALRLVGEQNED